MSQTIPNIELKFAHRRLRNSILNFFSEFGPISPEYAYDRPERSLNMRLYTLNKRTFVLVVIAFLICFILGIFIGIAGPEITLLEEIDALKVANGSQITTGPFKIKSQLISPYSRQLWLFAKYEIDNTENEIFDMTFFVDVQIKIIEESTLKIADHYEERNKTRHLKCKGKKCEEFTILHLGWIEYFHYQFKIKFYGLENKNYVNKLTFYIKTFNPAFTSMEISFRLIFLLLVSIVQIWFHYLLRKHPVNNWSIEQKFTYVLLPLAVLFNNPLFPLVFLIKSPIVGMIDALFQSAFMCALLLFWISIYHALRQNDRSFMKFYLPKIIIVSPIVMCACVLTVWEKLDEFVDPTFIHSTDSNYSRLSTCFYISVAIYLIYLLYIIFSAYSDLRSMQYFDMRLKFLSILMLFVIGVTLLTTFSRYGFGIVEENFVAQLSTSYQSSAFFMCFYGMINFYIITITYVYSPVFMNSEPVKDNPAFSMINDSDEEVVYASEEESRRPLNLAGKTAEYDSD